MSLSWAPHEKRAVKLIYGSITDGKYIDSMLCEINPDEVCDFGAQSYVCVTFDQPN